MSRLALALSAAGAEVGLWSADGSVADTPLVASDAPLRRLAGTAKQALVQFGADLIHDNGLWRPHNHQLAILSHSKCIPRLISTRGMLEPWARRHKKWKKDIAWLAYQRRDVVTADMLHTTATQEADNLARLNLGPSIQMIPNGVDVPALPDVRAVNNLRTAMFLGRLYPVKGLPLLIEAWHRVRPEGWRLVLAGPDEAGHRAELQAKIAAHKLEEQIVFAGPLDGQAKEAAFFGANLFILPSHSESFGMAVAEALAHGIPVLTTKAVPWPVLEDRKLGWRVPVSIEGLAEGLSQATATTTEKLRAMGEKGRTLVAENYGWDNVASQFLSTYSKLIAERAG